MKIKEQTTAEFPQALTRLTEPKWKRTDDPHEVCQTVETQSFALAWTTLGMNNSLDLRPEICSQSTDIWRLKPGGTPISSICKFTGIPIK